MEYMANITVPANLAESLEHALRHPNAEHGRDDIIWEGSCRFPDQTWALFQVISSNDPGDEPCWAQCVLFDQNGSEIATTDVLETLLGECRFDLADGSQYCVNVIAGS